MNDNQGLRLVPNVRLDTPRVEALLRESVRRQRPQLTRRGLHEAELRTVRSQAELGNEVTEREKCFLTRRKYALRLQLHC